MTTTGRPTLMDTLRFTGEGGLKPLLEENLHWSPEVSGYNQYRTDPVPNVGFSAPIDGVKFSQPVRVGLPSFGFRKANNGVNPGKSEYEDRDVRCFIVEQRIEIDEMVALSHARGAEAYITQESSGHVQAIVQGLGDQFYYGSDPLGFQGISAFVDDEYLVDATGSTPDTGSSVYAVVWGPMDVAWVPGRGGEINFGEIRRETIIGANDLPLDGLVRTAKGFIGVQALSRHSIGRICNLTAQDGKGLTDDLIAQLIGKMKKRPDVLFMSRRSLTQLQQSKTATNATGAAAPFPTESMGIPILATDNIRDTEPIVA